METIGQSLRFGTFPAAVHPFPKKSSSAEALESVDWSSWKVDASFHSIKSEEKAYQEAELSRRILAKKLTNGDPKEPKK